MSTPPAPIVKTEHLEEVQKGLYVIPDQGVPLVPNIGIVVGNTGVLVVDTGMGAKNAARVLSAVEKISQGKDLYLTTTHFHPEHSYGSSIFKGKAKILMNRDQLRDIENKGKPYLDFFRTFGDTVASELENVDFVQPDISYDTDYTLDLGGRTVTMHATGQAHTLGDQVIRVPDISAVFCGDLVEESQFSIFPWFPPEDVDVSGEKWIKVIQSLISAGDSLVIPGHGRVSDRSLLIDVHDYLTFLKREVWTRFNAGLPEEKIIQEVGEMAKKLHPNWVGDEWIEKGIQCFCNSFAHGKN